jgi:hypothetical protein
MIDSFLLQTPTLNISQKLLDGMHSGTALFLELALSKNPGPIDFESIWSNVLKPNGLRTESENWVN